MGRAPAAPRLIGRGAAGARPASMGWGDAVRDSGRPIVVGVAAIGAGVVRVATGMVKRSIIAGVIATLSVSLGAWPVVWLAISLLTAGGAAYPLRRRHKRAVELRAREVAARWGPERQKREAAAVAAMVAMRARRDDERRRGANEEQRDATMAAMAPWASPHWTHFKARPREGPIADILRESYREMRPQNLERLIAYFPHNKPYFRKQYAWAQQQNALFGRPTAAQKARAAREREQRRQAQTPQARQLLADRMAQAFPAPPAPPIPPAPPTPSVAAPDMAGEVFAARRHLYQGLQRYVDHHLTLRYGTGWAITLATTWRGPGTPMDATKPDLAGLRRVLIAQWGQVFAGTWPQRPGTLDDLHHLRDARNRTSHEDEMPPPEAYRAVSLMLRLLRDIKVPEADAVARLLATIEAAD